MTLLATSNPRKRYPVNILLYGQSTTAAFRHGSLEQEIRDRFPHADITFENRAISGFSSDNRKSAIANLPLRPPWNH